ELFEGVLKLLLRVLLRLAGLVHPRHQQLAPLHPDLLERVEILLLDRPATGQDEQQGNDQGRTNSHAATSISRHASNRPGWSEDPEHGYSGELQPLVRAGTRASPPPSLTSSTYRRTRSRRRKPAR